MTSTTTDASEREKLTTGELYVHAMAWTSAIIEAVRADQWRAPTPCTEWNVKHVANHLISENLWAGELFQGKTIAEVGTALDGDLAGDDPPAAYRASVGIATEAVTKPSAMETVCHLSFGDYSGSDYAAQLLLDTLIHGWDVAKGAGQDTRLDPRLVEACLPIADEVANQFLAAGAYGDNLPVSPDADAQTMLLARVGRKA